MGFSILTVLLMMAISHCAVIDNIEVSKINKQFNGFQLYHSLPQTFVLNQVFRIYGKVTHPAFYTGDATTLFYFSIRLTDISNPNNTYYCYNNFQIHTKEFDLSCRIMVQGKYKIKLLAFAFDLDGNRIQGYQDKDIVHQSENVRNVVRYGEIVVVGGNVGVGVEGFQVGVGGDGGLLFKWGGKSALANLTVYQVRKDKNNSVVKKQFLLSNFHQKFAPQFHQFKEFGVGEVIAQLTVADSTNGFLSGKSSAFSSQVKKLSFIGLPHAEKLNYQYSYIAQPQFPSYLPSPKSHPLSLTFQGRASNFYTLFTHNTPSITKSIITNKKQFKSVILPLNKIQFQLPLLKSPQTYLLDIKQQDNFTIIHQPIYVGGYPLVPLYMDYVRFGKMYGGLGYGAVEAEYVGRYYGEVGAQPKVQAKYQDKIDYLLKLVNKDRQKFGSPQLKADPQLNKLGAQLTKKIKEQGIFTAFKYNNENIQQIAKQLSIVTGVQSYLWKSDSLTKVHLQSQLQVVKKSITVNKLFTRVGFGILRFGFDTDVQYLVTYHFSSRDLTVNPPTKQQLSNFQQRLLTAIKSKNTNILTEDKELSNILNSLIQADKNITGQSLEQKLNALQKYGKNVRVWQRQVYLYDGFFDDIKNDSNYDNLPGSKIGLAFSVTKDSYSSLKLYFVLL